LRFSERTPRRKVGIEFEFFGPNIADVQRFLTDVGLAQRGWMVEYDGSSIGNTADGVLGLEMKSPPLSGIDGVRQLRGACTVLRSLGAQYDLLSGLHVHYDAAGLSLIDIKRILSAFIAYEDALEFFLGVPDGRRYNDCHYAKSLQQKFSSADVHAKTQLQVQDRQSVSEACTQEGPIVALTHMFIEMHNARWKPADPLKRQAIERGLKAIHACKTVEDLMTLFKDDRNMKLNIQSLKKFGTLEYRQPGAVPVTFDGVMHMVVGFDLFLHAALEDLLPTGGFINGSSLEHKFEILMDMAEEGPIAAREGYDHSLSRYNFCLSCA
jgi:hypothetical protein